MQPGVLTISLDFELHWGVLHARTVESYRRNLLGARVVIPKLLELFSEHGIHVTWATVGLLFFESRDQLLNALPRVRPHYGTPELSSYEYIFKIGIGQDEEEDPYHFAPSLIALIQSYPNQEIATHTFSHFYCREAGQDAVAFAADLDASIAVAHRYGVRLRSIVFPHNQENPAYHSVLQAKGIEFFRGNVPSFMYAARARGEESILTRLVRGADSYLPLSSRNLYSPERLDVGPPTDVPASRFLRPCVPREAALQSLRLRRILTEMTVAARRGLIYHLWWHPHNFGGFPEQNLEFLNKILRHYERLARDYSMMSLTMAEIGERVARRDVASMQSSSPDIRT